MSVSLVRSVRLRVGAGAAKPGPAIGQALGPLGLNMAVKYNNNNNDAANTSNLGEKNSLYIIYIYIGVFFSPRFDAFVTLDTDTLAEIFILAVGFGGRWSAVRQNLFRCPTTHI